ncbi:MAG: tRNA (adenosine(37)-N6)-threonylcarbamoyltransferase complex dimerization subunit type 1 TsaB [Holosporales bacterium]
MTVLAFECANFSLSCAIHHEGKVFTRHFPGQDRGHDADLFPLLQALVQEAHVDFHDLERIVTTLGPGSFTGLRTGLAAAKGLEMALPSAVVRGIDSLTFVAEIWAQQTTPEAPFIVALESRRIEPFVQLFDASAAPLTPPSLGTTEVLQGYLAQHPITVIGDAACRTAEILDMGALKAETPCYHAEHLLHLALDANTWRLFQDLSPYYLREAEVNIKKP